MINKTLPPIPPLEFCKIDRAARILDCEIEDILHWSLIGAINLRALFVTPNCKYKLQELETYGNVLLHVQEGDEYREGYFRYVDEMHSKLNKLIVIDGLTSYDYTRDGMPKTKIQIFIPPPYDGSTLIETGKSSSGIERNAVLSGSFYVFLTDEIIELMLSGEYIDEVALGATSADGKEHSFVTMRLCMKSIDFMSSLRISHTDLLKLQKHLITGELFSDSDKEKSPLHSTDKPEQSHHGITREDILAAAIHAKERWPDECGNTAAKWARTIEDHEAELFESKKIPLSLEKITRILGAAMNRGKSHKNTSKNRDAE